MKGCTLWTPQCYSIPYGTNSVDKFLRKRNKNLLSSLMNLIRCMRKFKCPWFLSFWVGSCLRSSCWKMGSMKMWERTKLRDNRKKRVNRHRKRMILIFHRWDRHWVQWRWAVWVLWIKLHWIPKQTMTIEVRIIWKK